MNTTIKNEWNKIYSNHKPQELPWHDLPFTQVEAVKCFLQTINKEDLLIIPGCGVGDTVNRLYQMGFHNIIGTDISEKAIEIASIRFPYIRFSCILTEEISKRYSNVNTIDWLNLHQINSPKNYLDSLNLAANNLLLVYFYDESKEKKIRSIIKENGFIYNHSPNEVFASITRLKKINGSIFYTGTNRHYNVGGKFRTVALTFKNY